MSVIRVSNSVTATVWTAETSLRFGYAVEIPGSFEPSTVQPKRRHAVALQKAFGFILNGLWNF